MPVLRQQARRAAGPRQPQPGNRAAIVDPACDLAACADVAWTLAQLDAHDVLHHAGEAAAAPGTHREGRTAGCVRMLTIRTRGSICSTCAIVSRVNSWPCAVTNACALYGVPRLRGIVNAGPEGPAMQFALFGGTVHGTIRCGRCGTDCSQVALLPAAAMAIMDL